MITVKKIRISILITLFISIIIPAKVTADDDSILFLGSSYLRGGTICASVFVADISSNGGYGTFHLNVRTGDRLPEFAVSNDFAGHFGLMLGGSDAFAAGIGGIWGYSRLGTGSGPGAAAGHYGVELPFMLTVSEDLPVFLLPFWEVMVAHKEKARRYGLNMVTNLQAAEPFSVHFECGVYYNQFRNTGNTSGLGYDWLIGIGFDIW